MLRLEGAVPAGLAGLQIGLVGIGVGRDQNLLVSNTAGLTIE